MDAIKALFALADRYSVPREEIASWVKEHVKDLCCTYTISAFELDLFKNSLEDFEQAHYKNAQLEMCQALDLEKKETFSSSGRMVTLRLRNLV